MERHRERSPKAGASDSPSAPSGGQRPVRAQGRQFPPHSRLFRNSQNERAEIPPQFQILLKDTESQYPVALAAILHPGDTLTGRSKNDVSQGQLHQPPLQ
jgi:hypothetical protein